ncbi:hypothetical protein CHS0354_037779 [Potamilus streckersoni]|uniref:Actin-interacting protein 1 n=1 Tax=Potamilus streckersoni TaxID=2493646 RepID=A0AAE0W688_9BIVA|nr:hypothetical protein CHS0354_037779 [Potamilus streckersoni]
MTSYTARSVFATLPTTTRGQPLVLGGDPKGKNFLYTCGNSVIIRDIENPAIADIYTEHAKPVIVAKYSPSGFYIASGDASGKIRIWDTVNKEHILKNEYQPIGGPIKDLAWSSDSQKIVVGGDGREKFGHVFTADSGNSVGEITGHSKSINSVDFRTQRPFRIVTASEDQSLVFLEGPPFKFSKTLNDHSNFVNAVRFSPDGEIFISGGADGKALIYDGKTADRKGELGPPAHKGGIYGLNFSKDGRQLLTVSGDKTAKIWDVEKCSIVSEFVFGNAVDNMQLGCLWQGNHLLTVSLSGYINYLDVNNPSRPLRIIKGHNKPITAMCVSEDRQTIYTASSDSRIYILFGNSDEVTGKGHTNQVQDINYVSDKLISIGMDDTLRITHNNQFSSDSNNLPSQPQAIDTLPDGTSVIACLNHVVVAQNGMQTYSQQLKYEACSVSIHPGGTTVAVGGQNNKIQLYTLRNGTLSDGKVIPFSGTPLDLKYSPDGAYLAVAGGDRNVAAFRLPEYEEIFKDTFHTARVNCVAWNPSSTRFATGSLDSGAIVWDPAAPRMKNYTIMKNIHRMAQITRIAWISDNTLVTTGQDNNVKVWNIKF